MSMWGQLSPVAADYTAEELNIGPTSLTQVQMTPKNIYTRGDGSDGVVKKGALYFIATAKWDIITEAHHDYIADLYNAVLKGDETARSLYFDHPKDGHSYTFYFNSEVKGEYLTGVDGYMKIGPTKLRIVGRKPV